MRLYILVAEIIILMKYVGVGLERCPTIVLYDTYIGQYLEVAVAVPAAASVV